ncbi:MAG: DoxX family protein [Roseivirga sp.]
MMAGMYILAGIPHFWKPKAYLKIMPPYIPYPLTMVYLSGALEIIFGILLVLPETQSIGAWGIIIVLVGVFPANVHMLFTDKRKRLYFTILLWLRLPVQGWLVYWAWLFT